MRMAKVFPQGYARKSAIAVTSLIVVTVGMVLFSGFNNQDISAQDTELGPTAQEWFDGGKRIPYDPESKRVLPPEEASSFPNTLNVFERVVQPEAAQDAEVPWATFSPGFPDGSFGFAKVDAQFSEGDLTPRLFVEYVGQGDSDKPGDYSYSTFKRADLVEALWREHGITSTFVVAFDYSNIVLLELLSRQQERIELGSAPFTQIEGVLTINGGLFADAHTHPWYVTPLLKSPLGTLGTWVGQRSNLAFNLMLKPVFSEDYDVSEEELNEIFNAITRRNGASFMSRAAGFVDEHKENENRWDLERLYPLLHQTVSFELIGSEGDILEFSQILKAQERLGSYDIEIQVIPGGHMATAERPKLLAEIIQKSQENNSYIEGDSNVGTN